MIRRAVGTLLRYLLLALAIGAVHAALLWLVDPWVPVPPPTVVRIDPASRDYQPAREDEVVVVVGGDTAPTDAALPTLQQRGYEYPFAATLGLVRRTDLTLVNLEAPVTRDAAPFPLYKRYVYKVDPVALQAMSWAGVNAVTLANNHIMDHGRAGVLDTLRNLQRAGIAAVGAGRSVWEARRGVVFDIRGTRVGVLSYMQDSLMHSVYVRSFAEVDLAGCARLSLSAARSDIARLRRAADLVVVVVHWGQSYSDVSWHQRFFGRRLVRYGADVVVGHHPHVHQPMAVYDGRPVLFSLGNYAFGTPGQDWFRHGLLARLRLRGGKLHRIELIPLLVQNRMVHFKPEPVRGAAARSMLRRLVERSRANGADLRIEDNLAVWEPR